MSAALQWLAGQAAAMEESLAALVCENSFTGNRTGGNAVGRLLDACFELPGFTREVVPSKRFADHRVYRSAARSDGKPVVLIGHLDTVFPPGTFEGYRSENGRGFGPGSLDMKGGLVVMAWALKALAHQSGVAAPVKVVIVADEEVGSPEGAEVLRAELKGAQAALVFEAGRETDGIITRRRGTGAITAEAFGRAAHSGNAYWSGVNAIWALASFVGFAQEISSRETETTVNVGLIQGGTSKNTVPAEARAELDLRYPTSAAYQNLADALALAAERAERTVVGATLRLSQGVTRPPMLPLPGTAALLTRYAACAGRAGLGSGEAPPQGGGSDGNTSAAMGIPTLDGLGPRGHGFHTKEEYVELESLVPKAQALADFLLGCR